MKHSYIIIDDDPQSIQKTQAVAGSFPNLQFIASAQTYEDGLDLILQYNPEIVFLEIDPQDKASNLSLFLINELYRYLKIVPKIIITTNGRELAFEAMRYEVFDYFTKPIEASGLRKAILRINKTNTEIPQFFSAIIPAEIETMPVITEFANAKPEIPEEIKSTNYPEEELKQAEPEHPNELTEDVEEEQETSSILTHHKSKEEKPLIICVKSYGDYRFIEAKDICYLQADNNSTDIHLFNGEMITAFKTLKHFEGVLSSPFVRIHNSYIVNIDYVSRIHTGNAVCYIKNTTTKLPFSKSYKENVDSIISSITNGNYLEI